MPEPTTQPNSTTADPTTQPNAEPTTGATPATFEAWLEGQDETVKTLYQSHNEKLLNTVKSTRDERDAFKKQIKELSSKATEGSELKQQLDAMTAQLDKAEKRAAFLEEAVKPEIQCQNPRAAWLLAEASELFDKKGLPDWAAIKGMAPELFGRPTANANAGAGTGNPPPKPNNMNSWIRRTAGRE